jgi:hypothetical protein
VLTQSARQRARQDEAVDDDPRGRARIAGVTATDCWRPERRVLRQVDYRVRDASITRSWPHQARRLDAVDVEAGCARSGRGTRRRAVPCATSHRPDATWAFCSARSWAAAGQRHDGRVAHQASTSLLHAQRLLHDGVVGASDLCKRIERGAPPRPLTSALRCAPATIRISSTVSQHARTTSHHRETSASCRRGARFLQGRPNFPGGLRNAV